MADTHGLNVLEVGGASLPYEVAMWMLLQLGLHKTCHSFIDGLCTQRSSQHHNHLLCAAIIIIIIIEVQLVHRGKERAQCHDCINGLLKSTSGRVSYHNTFLLGKEGWSSCKSKEDDCCSNSAEDAIGYACICILFLNNHLAAATQSCYETHGTSDITSCSHHHMRTKSPHQLPTNPHAVEQSCRQEKIRQAKKRPTDGNSRDSRDGVTGFGNDQPLHPFPGPCKEQLHCWIEPLHLICNCKRRVHMSACSSSDKEYAAMSTVVLFFLLPSAVCSCTLRSYRPSSKLLPTRTTSFLRYPCYPAASAVHETLAIYYCKGKSNPVSHHLRSVPSQYKT